MQEANQGFVEIVARVSDDIGIIEPPRVYYSFNQSNVGFGNEIDETVEDSERISGTELDGVYSARVALPHHKTTDLDLTAYSISLSQRTTMTLRATATTEYESLPTDSLKCPLFLSPTPRCFRLQPLPWIVSAAEGCVLIYRTVRPFAWTHVAISVVRAGLIVHRPPAWAVVWQILMFCDGDETRSRLRLDACGWNDSAQRHDRSQAKPTPPASIRGYVVQVRTVERDTHAPIRQLSVAQARLQPFASPTKPVRKFLPRRPLRRQ